MPTVNLPRRLRALLAVPALLVAVTGCSSIVARPSDAPGPPGPPSVVDDFPRSRVVALDFVDAMAQLPELAPARTTLYTARPATRFGQILVSSLQNAGYDLRLGAPGDPETLGYEVSADVVDARRGGERYTFLVSAARVRMKRTYAVDGAGIRPTTSMRVHGADATTLAAADPPSRTSIAPRGATLSPVPLPPAVVASASLLETSPPIRTGATLANGPSTGLPTGPPTGPNGDGSAAGADTTAREETAARAGTASARRADLPRKRNLYETRRSNYADLLATYETLRREIMVFPNDSLHMGRDNKRVARAMADAFDPARDVISVIGCSHGRTALANGNETLANGRSFRVKEALMLAGVAPDRVLEEGCWAGQHFEMMPARGVVVTHKRRAEG